MLGLILAQQSVLLLLVHLALLALARRFGERVGPSAARLVPLGWGVVAACLLYLGFASGATGHAFLLGQLFVFFTCALVAACDPARLRTHVFVTHAALFALLLRFLVWRGLYDADGPTATTHYVFQDFAAQLLLPAAGYAHDALVGPGESAFLASLRAGVFAAARGVTGFLALLASLTTFATAVVAVRAATSRRAPKTLRELVPVRDGVPSILLLVLVVGFVPTVDVYVRALALGVLVPPMIVEAALVLDRNPMGLRANRFALAALGAAIPFVPSVVYGLAAFGGFVALLPGPPATTDQPGRASLLAWSAGGTAVVVAFGLLAGGSGALLAPSRGLPSDAALCAATRFETSDRAVLVSSRGRAPYRIDIDERPLDSASPAEAEAACASEGKHLCSSDEIYRVCACDHGSDGFARDLSPIPRDGLVERARCSEDADAVCASDHGVRDLLGGRSEVTSTTVAHAGHLVAGPNRWLRENWMVHCRWRGVMSAEVLDDSALPMLGYRCCAPAP